MEQVSGPLVVAHGLRKCFGDFTAVAGVDFEVAAGEAFGFLGPNAAGKSSTMRMIGATSSRSGGDLCVLGKDPDHDGPAIRARLGVVPQEDNLDLELSVADNLFVYGRYFGIGRKELRGRINELLEFARLWNRAGDRVDDLSGGMRRRLTDHAVPGERADAPVPGRADDRPGPPRHATCCGTACSA